MKLLFQLYKNLIKKGGFFLFLIISLNVFSQNKNSDIKFSLAKIYQKYDYKLRPYINKVQDFRKIHDNLPSEKRLEYAFKIEKEEREALDILSKGEKLRLKELKKLLENIRDNEKLIKKNVIKNNRNYKFDKNSPESIFKFVKTLITEQCKNKYSKYFETHNFQYFSTISMLIDADGKVKEVTTTGDNEEFNVFCALLVYEQNLLIKPQIKDDYFVLSGITIMVREY